MVLMSDRRHETTMAIAIFNCIISDGHGDRMRFHDVFSSGSDWSFFRGGFGCRGDFADGGLVSVLDQSGVHKPMAPNQHRQIGFGFFGHLVRSNSHRYRQDQQSKGEYGSHHHVGPFFKCREVRFQRGCRIVPSSPVKPRRIVPAITEVCAIIRTSHGNSSEIRCRLGCPVASQNGWTNRVKREKKSQVLTGPDQSETVDYTGRTDTPVRFRSGLEFTMGSLPNSAPTSIAAVCIHTPRNRYQ